MGLVPSVHSLTAFSHFIPAYVNGFKWTQRRKEDPFVSGFMGWTVSPRDQDNTRAYAKGEVRRGQLWTRDTAHLGKVLSLYSNIKLMHCWLGCNTFALVSWMEDMDTPRQHLRLPLFSPLSTYFLHWCCQTKPPPALALALQWRTQREAGWSQTSAYSQQEWSIAVRLQLISGMLQ